MSRSEKINEIRAAYLAARADTAACEAAAARIAEHIAKDRATLRTTYDDGSARKRNNMIDNEDALLAG